MGKGILVLTLTSIFTLTSPDCGQQGCSGISVPSAAVRAVTVIIAPRLTSVTWSQIHSFIRFASFLSWSIVYTSQSILARKQNT